MLARTSRTCQWLMGRRLAFNYTAYPGGPRQANDWDTPPKYVYEQHYLPIINPLMFGGFPSHQHGGNPFINEAESHFDLFQYDYPGQWWHLGSSAIIWLGISFPFALIILLMFRDSETEEIGIGVFDRKTVKSGGYFPGSMANIEY